MMKGMKPLLIVMVISLVIAGLWDKVSLIKNFVHYILDPTFGGLLDWNLLWGFIIIAFLINLVLTIIHKYATDQEELKRLKEEGKEVRKQMQELKEQPDKMMELQKKQMANVPKSFELTMKPLMFSAIPLILLFRWFNDYFILIDSPKIIFGLSWLWSYIIFSIVFNIILRKLLRVH